MKKRGYIEIKNTEQLFSVLWGIMEKVSENIPGERASSQLTNKDASK